MWPLLDTFLFMSKIMHTTENLADSLIFYVLIHSKLNVTTHVLRHTQIIFCWGWTSFKAATFFVGSEIKSLFQCLNSRQIQVKLHLRKLPRRLLMAVHSPQTYPFQDAIPTLQLNDRFAKNYFSYDVDNF